jgi:nitrate reductase NapE component
MADRGWILGLLFFAEESQQEQTMGVDAGRTLILVIFGLAAMLSGVACYYFSLFRPRRPGAIALILLTAFIFWQDLLWGGVFAVASMRDRLLTFDTLAESLFWPIFAVGLLGTLGTGLLFLLILRRELR